MSPLPDSPAFRRRHALVVVESGCDRLAWRRALAAAGATATTVVQRPGEAPAALAQRAIAELDDVTGSLILVASARMDTHALDARAQLLRAFADAGRPGERRTIQLDGGGVARFAMEALSEMASEQLRSSGIRVLGPSENEPRRVAA